MSFYLREYKKKAKTILQDAIQSVVFIDENALEPYQSIIKEDNTADSIQTQKLSKSLYKHFNRNNISLDIHKFSSVEQAKTKIKNKDIVLLDWHLDGVQSGEEHALQILEEIVKEEHIHFCCIYTNSQLDNVINNCVTYFSGYTEDFCTNVLEEYELDDDLVEKANPFLDRIFALPNPNDLMAIKKIATDLKKIPDLARSISRIEPLKSLESFNHKLKCLAYAAKSKLFKSNNPAIPTIDFLNKSENVFSIRNTVVIILKKDHAKDSEKLINKILDEIIEKHNSYLLMLGLEMQTYIKRSCAFITGDVLDVKNETIAYHWHQNIKNKNEVNFEDFVKQIMVDQIDSKIKRGNFILLKKDKFLNENRIRKTHDYKQLARINAFYNGSIIEGERLLNYGDIMFSPENNEYFLCITALCDCLHPKNINFRFFFVKGSKYSVESAIELGDEAFISYISDDECINWIQSGPATNRDNQKPVYIKPIQLYIPNSKITKNKITVLDWKGEESIKMSLEYKFTLRPQYAQRISNHAFSHPLRVGIDFLKI